MVDSYRGLSLLGSALYLGRTFVGTLSPFCIYQAKMTDCCLFVCMRPRTYQRLIQEIYQQHRQHRYDDSISPSESKIRRLVEYASTYPNKLRLVTTKLNRLFIQFFSSGSTGFTLLTVEIYRHMLHQFYHLQLTYLLEPHINFLLLECIQSRRVVYLRAAAVLIKDCVKYHAFSTNLSFLSSVLELCDTMHEDQGKSQENRTYSFIGFTILISLLKVLHHFPSWMETYFDRICGTIYRGIVACSSTRYRGEQSTRSRENSVAALLHSRSLYASTMKYLPRTLEDLCWKALQSLCATHSLSTIHAVINYMCLAFERGQLTIASKISIQALTIITMAYEDYSGLEYLLENALLDYVVYRLYEGKGSRKSMIGASAEQTEHASSQNGIPSMSQQRQYYFLHMGSEQRIREAEERLLLLQDVIDVLQVWRENDAVLTERSLRQKNNKTSSSFSLESFIYIVRSLLQIQAYLIVQYPFLLSVDVFAKMEDVSQPLASIFTSIRSLPTKLRAIPLPSTNSPSIEGVPVDIESPKTDEVSTVTGLVHTLHHVAQSLAHFCTPLGTNASLLWEQTLTWINSIEEQRFSGHYHNNKSIAMFRVHGLYLCQVLLQYIPLSVPSIQLSTLISTSGGATGQGQTLVSDSSWDILHRWLVESSHWEELRHVFLVMIKLVGAAEPAIRQLLHANTSSSSTSSAAAAAAVDASPSFHFQVPVFQNVISNDAASSRQQFTFSPFSLKQIHFVHSVLFDHMEVMGRGLSALRVICWSRFLQMMLHLYGEYEMLLSLPMILTLLQEAEHQWEDAYQQMDSDDQEQRAPAVPQDAQKILLQSQREEYRRYLLALVIHYFHLIARGFQIPSLMLLLQQWYQQHDDPSQIFPSSLVVDFAFGTLELQPDIFADQYLVEQQQRLQHNLPTKAAVSTNQEHSDPLVPTTTDMNPVVSEDEVEHKASEPESQTIAVEHQQDIIAPVESTLMLDSVTQNEPNPVEVPTESANITGASTTPPKRPKTNPLNIGDIMRKLVSHPRFQPLTLHLTRAFEQAFMPFSEEYVSDLVETSSVFGGRATPSAVRSRAGSSASRTHGHSGEELVGGITGRSRANSRASSTGASRTPGKILTGTASHHSLGDLQGQSSSSFHALLSTIPKSPSTKSVVSHQTAHTHLAHATKHTHIPVKTTIHQLAISENADPNEHAQGLAMVETFLSVEHSYPAMSFPYKTQMWKDAFLMGIADMEKMRGVEDVVRYLDEMAEDSSFAQPQIIDPQELLLPDENDMFASDANLSAVNETNNSFTSWLPSLLQRGFSS